MGRSESMAALRDSPLWRSSYRLVVGGHLAAEPMAADKVPVVGGEEQQRAVEDARPLEVADEHADAVIDDLHHGRERLTHPEHLRCMLLLPAAGASCSSASAPGK